MKDHYAELAEDWRAEQQTPFPVPKELYTQVCAGGWQGGGGGPVDAFLYGDRDALLPEVSEALRFAAEYVRHQHNYLGDALDLLYSATNLATLASGDESASVGALHDAQRTLLNERITLRNWAYHLEAPTH